MANHTARAERWRCVVGYEGYYEVSDLGRVRSVDRVVKRKDGVPMRLRGCDMRLSRRNDETDHLAVNLTKHAIGVRMPVHILVLTAFVGPRPPGLFGCHKNGNALDNRLTNLRWASPQQNAQDMLRHGTNAYRSRTLCKRGHLLAPPNLVPRRWAVGHRNCLACSRAYSGRQQARRHGREFDFDAVADCYYEVIMKAA